MQAKMFFQTINKWENQANLTLNQSLDLNKSNTFRRWSQREWFYQEESRNESQVTNAKKSLETLRLFTHANWSKKGINQQSKKPIRCISTDLGSQKDKNSISKILKRLFAGKECNTVREAIILAGNLWARCEHLALNPMSRVRTWLILIGCS